MKPILFISLLSLLPSCTENQRAKSFGGNTEVDIPKGHKFVNATWKNEELWYLYRPAREGEKPETTTMQEQSSFGVMEGSVTFKESK